MIIDVVAGALCLLFTGGIAVFNTIKGAQLSSRVLEIQRSVSETNEQLHSLEVSVLTNRNSTIQLARSFSIAQENKESMRINMETIMKHVSRLDSFAEAQTLYNLKTHGERIYDRMKTSMHRIKRNDFNLDFVGVTEQNEILELALTVDLKNRYLLLKNQRQHLSLACCLRRPFSFFHQRMANIRTIVEAIIQNI